MPATKPAFLVVALLVLAALSLPASAGTGSLAPASLDAGETAYTAGDFDTAARHFLPLAEQGHPQAQYNLALLYEEGQGVEQDFGKAREWYRRAAAQGNVDACYALGQMSLKGLGEPKDLVRAHLWFELASRAPHAHRLAAEARTKVARQMTAAEIDAARQLLLDWGKQPRLVTGALRP